MRPLRDLGAGQSARLTQIGGERAFRRRLMEMGFLPGTLVRVVRRVDIADLVEIEVRGSRISRVDPESAVVLESEDDRPTATGPRKSVRRPPLVVAGNLNTGKTTVSPLDGLRPEGREYPGVTVERHTASRARWRRPGGVLDVPGPIASPARSREEGARDPDDAAPAPRGP
jgi:Fe2+ transport system protein FeoA